MNKLLLFLSVFRQGEMVANPKAWKTGQITASVLAGLIATLITLARAFGYDLPLTDSQIIEIGGAIIAIAGLFINPAVTAASTDKIGLPPRVDKTNGGAEDTRNASEKFIDGLGG